MATERWIAGSGVGFTWTQAFATADLTSLANGSSVLSSQGDITNQSSLDIFADFSFKLASITPAAPNTVALFLALLNHDGTTYGDGQFTAGTQSTAIPSASMWKRNWTLPTVSQAQTIILERIVIPPGTFRPLITNRAGANFSASTNAIFYRTYNRQVT